MNTIENKKGGFTIIELLVVVAIIGVLSGIVLQTLAGARMKTRNVTRMSDIDQISKALELYATGGKSFPSTPPVGGSDTWVCVKKATCTNPVTGLVGPTSFPPLTTALTPNISMIPTDPNFTTGIGDDYTYSSNAAPAGLANGAYLSWVTEGSGAVPFGACGRGTYKATGANGFICFLRLGNSN